MDNSEYKYVVLRGLEHDNKFFTSNSEHSEILRDGTVGYEILGRTHTVEEAQFILHGDETDEERQQRMKEHMMKEMPPSLGITEADFERMSKLL
jgi:hypothetical protein